MPPTNNAANKPTKPFTKPTAADLSAKADKLRARNALRLEQLRGRALRDASEAMRRSPGPNSARRIGGAAVGVSRFGSIPSLTAISDYQKVYNERTRGKDRGAGGSETHHLDWRTLDYLRRDCQLAARTNPLASAMLERSNDLVVADGPIVQSASGDPEWDRVMDETFAAWSDGRRPELGMPDVAGVMSLPQLLAAINAAWITDGDVLVHSTEDSQGRPAIQLVESERIVNKFGGLDTETMKAGVEVSEYGAPLKYYVASWDGRGKLNTADPRAIDAADAVLLANPIGFRAGQVRGRPALAAAVPWIQMLSEYVESTVVASYIATCLGLIFKTDKPSDLQSAMASIADSQGEDVASTGDEPQTFSVAPGWHWSCKPGESVEQVKPEQPATNFRDFSMTVVQLVGADLGLPLAITLYEASALNFSNLRGMITLAFRSVVRKQDILANRVVAPLRAAVAAAWIESGVLQAPRVANVQAAIRRFTVVMPPPPVVDFKMEVEGYTAALSRNWMTDDQVTQLLGTGRADDIKARRAKERATDARLGITPAEMPGAVRPGETPTEAPAQTAQG